MSSPHLPILDVAPHRWRSRCVPRQSPAALECGRPRPRMPDLTLSFSVSLDEEFVRLETTYSGRVYDLGSRNHHYLLLTLARRRLHDGRAGVPPSAAGWVYVDELGHDPAMIAPRLNVDVFRIRQQFKKLGLPDAPRIIERRARMSQLRIGTDRIAIARI